jgi:hypothetical protein
MARNGIGTSGQVKQRKRVAKKGRPKQSAALERNRVFVKRLFVDRRASSEVCDP